MPYYLTFICIVFLIGSSPSDNTTPILEITKHPQIIVYGPENNKKGDVVVFLHGSCSSPKKYCHLFADEITSQGKWLICPGANNKCHRPSGKTWNIKKDIPLIEEQINFIYKLFPDKINKNNRTVIGFSLGSFLAAQLIQKKSNYNKAILIAGFVNLDQKKLKNKEIILAAGQKDMTYKYLTIQYIKLKKKNINVKFVSLGKIGHKIPKDIGVLIDEI